MNGGARTGPAASIAVLVDAGTRLFYVVSHEEERVLARLAEMAGGMFRAPRPIATWTVTDGWSDGVPGIAAGAAAGEPLAALDAVRRCDAREAVLVLRDLHPYLSDGRIVRKLRDAYAALEEGRRVLVLLSPVLALPDEVGKDVHVVDFPLPAGDEVELAVQTGLAALSEDAGSVIEVPAADREAVTRALSGLTWDEIVRVVRKVGMREGRIGTEVLEGLLDEKRQIIRKSEILDYIVPRFRLADVGGLKAFKRWVRVRGTGFTDAARAFGLPRPKGILFTGISGCGKSLAIQALAAEWNLPLLRLDMGRVFAGFLGTPEESMRRALRTVEAVAPALLWIDEIEMGISVFSDSVESGATSRIFAMFLTWMQEKTAPVFIGATANDIDRLPPEFIRKGRFDEVFFVDLPGDAERREVFKIHLNTRGKDVSEISLDGLVKSSNGFSGAEIEQAIIGAMYEAFAEGRELTIDDLYRSLGRMVPLAVTMKEQILKTKRWAENRAVRAS
jgi:SpoVK/Ycf46/Vps4 family AAA+-type ATPase